METDKKIRLLFLIGSYGTGGKERQLAELIKGLPSGEFEIHLLIKSEGAHYLDDIKEKLSSFYSLDRARFGRKAFKDIVNHINNIKPDVIHSWADTTSFYAALARPFVKGKSVLIDGSIRMAPPSVNRLSVGYAQRKVINAFSDIVVANSQAGLKTYKVPERKSRCIYNGFDPDRLASLKDPFLLKSGLGIMTEYLIGMVARFDHEKDWLTFFRAAEKMLETRQDVTFIAVGGGIDMNKYRERVKPADRDRFVFTGERNDVESIVNLMDIGILASYSEGISNSIIEYMALGKPVIASGTGGIPELVDHNMTGLIFAVGDYEALFQSMNKLINESRLRNTMGAAAKKRISETFGFRQFVNAYSQLYRSAVCAE
jgi:glycosyltransferase involved in cell wall biosynthesis